MHWLLFFLFSVFSYAGTCAAPVNMICVPGGSFYMGRDDSRWKDETPRHLVKLTEFYLDEALVTVKDFRLYVEKTNYVTTGEKRGYGMVAKEGMKNWEWKKTPGANWRQPFGPELRNKIPISDDLPVTSVSWDDANAYCLTQGKRLPTEAEWEYAARAGKSDIRFPWGNSPYRKDGKLGLNFWQGVSHQKNEFKDGFLYVSPVKAFPANDWGMYDPVGNVWQHVADRYSEGYFQQLASKGEAQDPKGPDTGLRRVGRGGSWWCSETTCDGFGLFRRGKAHPEAVFNNNGFRCAKSASIH